MAEQVAIVRNVKIGMDDRAGPCLRFDTYTSESSAASQFITWEEAAKIVATVDDIRQLEGKPCWVDVEGNLIKFLRMWSR